MGRIPSWLIILVWSLPALVSERRITCTSPETVNEKGSAVITCDYHINLREHGRGFYIYKYPFDGKGPDVPFICDWKEDFIQCDVQPGYEVKVQGHKMTLNISSAQQTHAGRYVCHVLQPEDDLQAQGCNLAVLKKGNSAKFNCHEITYPHQEQPTTLMCFVPESIGATYIILERHEPSGKAVEIIRCNSKSNECQTRHFGYLFNVSESSSTGMKVLMATVEMAGRYTCKTDGEHVQMETCSLDIQKDAKTKTSEVSSSQAPGTVTITLLVISAVLLILFATTFIWCFLRRRLKNSRQNHPGKETSPHKSEFPLVALEQL